jgi:bisphosphoglycerate-dependent phosphoglycerate mutase
MKNIPRGETTRTESTKEQYRSHYFRIERMARERLADSDCLVLPEHVAREFVIRETEWSEKTARAYRAALVFMFDEMDTPEAKAAKDTIYHVSEDGEWTMQRVEEVKAERKVKGKNQSRTSAQKAKRFTLDDLDLLRAELHVSSSKYAQATDMWFMAGMLTGLRPTEWKNVSLQLDDRGRKTLVVKNAKNTNGRAHGETRTLIIEALKKDDLDIIETHVNNVRYFCRDGDDGFTHLYDSCRRLIREIADRLWSSRKKHPTLYTARHIFAADIKNKFDSYGVAALMGHASTRTASSHYAPKWSTANGGSSIEPSDNDLNVVVARNEEKESPRILKRQKYLEELKAKRSKLS